MKYYHISAMVVYTDVIYSDSEENAVKKFIVNCPYDIDKYSIEIDAEEEQENEVDN